MKERCENGSFSVRRTFGSIRSSSLRLLLWSVIFFFFTTTTTVVTPVYGANCPAITTGGGNIVTCDASSCTGSFLFVFLIMVSMRKSNKHLGSCTAGQPCTVRCTAYRSCRNDAINYCTGASSCTLTCEAEEACRGATFDCPDGPCQGNTRSILRG